ncbi:hypothetical protein A2872_04555 [Candidatus Gottesmanbacteria bacterium RIFCSPHIGHO2_01_FULL_42_12]|uniref:8-oxo-dGTP diphosphatase n=1 Tax=Candidatus Gottesmanbacteria bacterium RIFCSPHIGHO2_01_FULL_42_12 TaxID=1798377 RepID=A0A1F5YZM8_9BACT|nr:MAG: hypothetical protein A2872_04555 [Candidatus Gottesmanbacteria bacterium RIFCSPHIGHO2_01_FULL_42_12]
MKKLKVALVLFRDENGNVLLNHRYDHQQEVEDVWEIVGGGIEENELPINTIKREIKEELGYEIDDEKDCLKFIDDFEEAYLFTAKFPGFENFSGSDEVKISDLKLFSVKDAMSLNLLPVARKILEMENESFGK